MRFLICIYFFRTSFLRSVCLRFRENREGPWSGFSVIVGDFQTRKFFDMLYSRGAIIFSFSESARMQFDFQGISDGSNEGEISASELLDQVVDLKRKRENDEAERVSTEGVGDPSLLEEASDEIEGDMIKLTILIGKMREKGTDYDAILRDRPDDGLVMLKRDEPRCFYRVGHRCRWSEPGEQGGGNVGCSLACLQKGDMFYSVHCRRFYRATGDVFVCFQSGLIHVCTAAKCDRQVIMEREESVVCELTKRNYGQPVVSSEPVPRTGPGGREDGMSYSAGFGRDGMRGPIRASGKGSAAGRRRRMVMEKAHERIEDRMRHDDRESPIVYSEGKSVPYLEEHMTELFPKLRHPEPTRQLRFEVSVMCRSLVYDRHVRASIWEKCTEADRTARTAVAAYYRECYDARRMRDPYRVMEIVNNHVRKHVDRLEVLGFMDTEPDPAVLVYFEECVVATWYMMSYTPFAQRFQSGVSLRKHAVGILYKLQTGFYVDVLCDPRDGRVVVHDRRTLDVWLKSKPEGVDRWTEPDGQEVALVTICFLPRHQFLERIPQKNDLNKYEILNDITSTNVVDSEKLICDCYNSLLELGFGLDMLAEFCLDRYVRVRDFLSD